MRAPFLEFFAMVSAHLACAESSAWKHAKSIPQSNQIEPIKTVYNMAISLTATQSFQYPSMLSVPYPGAITFVRSLQRNRCPPPSTWSHSQPHLPPKWLCPFEALGKNILANHALCTNSALSNAIVFHALHLK